MWLQDHHKPLVSIILPIKNEGDNVRTTLESALQVKTEYPIEIIAVDDGSTDGCCDFIHSFAARSVVPIQVIRTQGIGLAKAKNLGAECSKGLYLIFCDAHLFFEDLWIERLLEPIIAGQADCTTVGIASIDVPDVVGYGQTLDQLLGIRWCSSPGVAFPVAVIPGACFAISRHIFFDIGGFNHHFKSWGYEDVEISIKLWLFGYRCFVQPSAKVLHLFRDSFPYTVNAEDFYFNMLRMAYSHFNEERIQKCKKLVKDMDVDVVESLVLNSDVLKQRDSFFKRRKHDDSWFFKMFAIPF